MLLPGSHLHWGRLEFREKLLPPLGTVAGRRTLQVIDQIKNALLAGALSRCWRLAPVTALVETRFGV